jgi:hypothetical protein
MAEKPENNHRANQWFAVHIFFGRQGSIARTDSTETSFEVSGHFQRVIIIISLQEVVVGIYCLGSVYIIMPAKRIP